MIRLRKECPEIGWGEWTILATGSRSVLGVRYEWRGTAVVCLHNLSPEPARVRVRVDGDLDDLLEDEQLQSGSGSVHELVLEGYAFRWFRAGLDNAALRGPAPDAQDQPAPGSSIRRGSDRATNVRNVLRIGLPPPPP